MRRSYSCHSISYKKDGKVRSKSESLPRVGYATEDTSETDNNRIKNKVKY